MSFINPLPPIPPVVPTGVLTLSREGREQELRPEQIIQASVAEGGQDKVLLEMGHRRVWAETQVLLRKGQKLNLQVVQTSPRVELRLMEMPLTERIGHALHLLGGKWDLLPLLTRLIEGNAAPLPSPANPNANSGPPLSPSPTQAPPTAAESGSPQPSGPPAAGAAGERPADSAQPLANRLSPGARETLQAFKEVLSNPSLTFDGAQFRQLLRQLGMHLEARLAAGDGEHAAATLKGALLEARQAMPEGGGERATQVMHLLQNLELFQLCSLRLAQEGAGLWPLPLPFLDQGYLMIEERHHQRSGQKEPPRQLALHLSLQTLGDLRIEFLHEPQGLFLRFVCDSEEKAEFFARFDDELRRGINSMPLLGLSFSSGAEPPARTLIQRVLGEEQGVLDERV